MYLSSALESSSILVYIGAFQPVRPYALGRMKKIEVRTTNEMQMKFVYDFLLNNLIVQLFVKIGNQLILKKFRLVKARQCHTKRFQLHV